MSFERPGMPRPSHEVDAEVEEALSHEGVELDDHEVETPDHPGAPSPGPQPYEARHRGTPKPEPAETDDTE
jgi:hypothetical protein